MTRLTDLEKTHVEPVVGDAPETLNTLEKFATAINNNPNFATDISNQLSNYDTSTIVDSKISAAVSSATQNTVDRRSLNINIF